MTVTSRTIVAADGGIGDLVVAGLPDGALDAGVAAFIGNEARRPGMTRKAYVEWMALRIAEIGG